MSSREGGGRRKWRWRGGVGVEEEQGTKGTKGALCFGANVNWIMLKYVLLVVCGL